MAVVIRLCLSSVIFISIWLSFTLYGVKVDSFALLKRNFTCTETYLSDMGSHRDKSIFRTSSIFSTLCCNSCSTIYPYIWRISTSQATQINICSWLKSVLCCNKVYKLANCVSLDISGLENLNLSRKQGMIICITNVISDTIERSPLELPFCYSIQFLHRKIKRSARPSSYYANSRATRQFTMCRRYCYKPWPVHKHNKGC